MYTSKDIKYIIELNIERLIRPWLVGRTENYVIDATTKNLVALGYWLNEELIRIGCNDVDRKTQTWKFNRLSRTYDMWDVATECLNDVLNNTIEQNRYPHRRWG